MSLSLRPPLVHFEKDAPDQKSLFHGGDPTRRSAALAVYLTSVCGLSDGMEVFHALGLLRECASVILNLRKERIDQLSICCQHTQNSQRSSLVSDCGE